MRERTYSVKWFMTRNPLIHRSHSAALAAKAKGQPSLHFAPLSAVLRARHSVRCLCPAYRGLHRLPCSGARRSRGVDTSRSLVYRKGFYFESARIKRNSGASCSAASNASPSSATSIGNVTPPGDHSSRLSGCSSKYLGSVVIRIASAIPGAR